MVSLYSGCPSLQSIDFTNCNILKEILMSGLFQHCASLKSLTLQTGQRNLGHINTIINGCFSLISFDFSK